MIETQQTVDTGCPHCSGSGWLRDPWDPSRGPRDLGLRRCPDCNAAPIEKVAAAENVRVFSDAKAKRRGNRREWWGE